MATGGATLSGLASVADEGSYNLKFKVVDTVDPSLSSVQQFTFYVIIDDYPPVYLSQVNQSTLSTIRFFTDEDSVHDEWIGSSGFHAINPDPEPDDYESLEWTVERNSSAGSSLQVSGAGDLRAFSNTNLRKTITDWTLFR